MPASPGFGHTAPMSTGSPTSRVLVLHGIWNADAWVLPLARRLHAEGFDAHVFGYPSVLGGPDVAIDKLAARLHRTGPTHLVGHSLGGLVALETLRRYPDLPVPRLVCLGSPLRGSTVAQTLAGRGWGGLLGRSEALLEAGCAPWSGQTRVGMIAGDVPHGVGRLLGAVGADSDGTVALAETRLPGLADHVVLPLTHTGLAFSPQAARLVARFLHAGRFGAPAQDRAAAAA